MEVLKKSKYILITSNENSFTKLFKEFSKVEKGIDEHIILEISKEINVPKENFSLFLNIAQEKRENGTSFVIISTNVDIDALPENLNVVPTLIEAEDIIEMEAIERELGF